MASRAIAATPQARDAAVAEARDDASATERHEALPRAALVLGILAAVGLIASGAAAMTGRRGAKPERDLTAAE